MTFLLLCNTNSPTELTKIISSKWKSLTTEEKIPYEEMAANDKKRVPEVNEDTVDSVFYPLYLCISPSVVSGRHVLIFLS